MVVAGENWRIQPIIGVLTTVVGEPGLSNTLMM
jgi:hypothetical protein